MFIRLLLKNYLAEVNNQSALECWDFSSPGGEVIQIMQFLSVTELTKMNSMHKRNNKTLKAKFINGDYQAVFWRG